MIESHSVIVRSITGVRPVLNASVSIIAAVCVCVCVCVCVSFSLHVYLDGESQCVRDKGWGGGRLGQGWGRERER